MKVSKGISIVAMMSILAGACKAPEKVKSLPPKKTSNSAGLVAESTGAEHCLKAGEQKYCFLEIDGEESIDFYATGESYDRLLTDPILPGIQIQIRPLDAASYEKQKKGVLTRLEYEGAKSNGVQIYTNKMDEGALFTDVMFRIITFLWKAAKNYNEDQPTGIIDKIKQKFSYYKDKLGNKISSIFGRGSVDETANSAEGLKARITWHYGGSAVVTKDLLIPLEYTAPPMPAGKTEPAEGEEMPAADGEGMPSEQGQ